MLRLALLEPTAEVLQRIPVSRMCLDDDHRLGAFNGSSPGPRVNRHLPRRVGVFCFRVARQPR